MPRTRNRPRPSKLALTLSLFFLSTLVASSAVEQRDGWRPDTELPGAKFILGDGKNEGSKVKGYDGEWPLWSSFRSSFGGGSTNKGKAGVDVSPGGGSSSTTAGTGAGNGTVYVCAPIGECWSCPDGVVHLPYCRPYNNRRRTSCVPITDPSSPSAIKAALSLASSSSTSLTNPQVLLGWEACGKSARQEGRDYFEMIAVVASIAIFSVWAFVQRQKLLFRRQDQMLQSRVSGSQRRRSSGIPGATVLGGGQQRGNRKRSARLGSRI